MDSIAPEAAPTLFNQLILFYFIILCYFIIFTFLYFSLTICAACDFFRRAPGKKGSADSDGLDRARSSTHRGRRPALFFRLLPIFDKSKRRVEDQRITSPPRGTLPPPPSKRVGGREVLIFLCLLDAS
jgi:hypothetical protein